ncbi:alpha/beta hydrolase [Glaciihabitans arcticus]|uniref:Alpha/beta hydrolase n=2 Tax=Glaciihabitans arcticus TaxID=2668039 RepID=A0A4Q9GZ45_9MICO|nr:alpha/beta hydrolase [Glaciihabitans arcticus]
MSAEGVRIATYEFGEEGQPTVVAVHGFSSSGLSNWQQSGWVRDLTRAGFRVLALDQRGHGASDKPHDTASYSMEILVADLLTVLDTYMIDETALLGYSLGARVSWHAALDAPDRVTRAVLGGIPDGDPLTRFQVDQARAAIANGTRAEDPLTQGYLKMASGLPGNDLGALVSLVEGMRGGPQPDPGNAPEQPLLFATGSEDPILDASRRLAGLIPNAEFVAIPGRHHLNAPTSSDFRAAGLQFLQR